MADGILNLGSLVGQASQDSSSQQTTQALSQDVGSSYFIFANYGLNILNTQILIESQNIGNAFILGSSTNGILGSNLLGSLNMIWGNSGGIWGLVSWGGTLPAYSVLYSNTISQQLTDLARAGIVNWFSGTALVAPTYVALGLGNYYKENFTTTTYKDAVNTTASWTGSGSVLF